MSGKLLNREGKTVKNNKRAEHLASFGRVAARTAAWVGTPEAFMIAVVSVVLWACLGPRFHYSDTWQLVVNTATTIITFLMVFLIQNTQNRDTRALNLKLDEIIRAIHGAHNEMIDIEHLSDDELKKLGERYEHIREEWTRRREAS